MRPIGAIVRPFPSQCSCVARTAEDAVAELRRWAGRQFDPQVVDLLCALFADQDEPAAELAAG